MQRPRRREMGALGQQQQTENSSKWFTVGTHNTLVYGKKEVIMTLNENERVYLLFFSTFS